MVQELFRCEVCSILYTDKEVAGENENHCNPRNICNVEYPGQSIDVASHIRTDISWLGIHITDNFSRHFHKHNH